jgi:hypothetical protein
VKILGFLLDDKLSMQNQISAVIKKANSATYAVRLAGKRVDLRTRMVMCDALAMSHFNYCDIALSQAGATDLARLQVAHNKVVRAVAGASHLASAAEIRSNLGWLDLENKRRVHLWTTVWKCFNAPEAPEALSSLLIPVNQIHGYGTRSATSNNLFVQRSRTVRASRSFAPLAVSAHNSMPPQVKLAKTAKECRNLAYDYLVEKAKSELVYRNRLRAKGREPIKIRHSAETTAKPHDNDFFYY